MISSAPLCYTSVCVTESDRMRFWTAGIEEAMEGKKEAGILRVLKFIRPIVISAAVVLIIFFLLQGMPVARTLYKRTDLISALAVQNGEEKLLTDPGEVVRAAEVAGMLARRLSVKESGEPDTYYIFTFEDGSELQIGVLEKHVLYDGKWYSGAAGTPDLFRNLTASRFFMEE